VLRLPEFTWVVPLTIDGLHARVCAGSPAVLVNLMVAAVLTPLLRLVKVAERLDTTDIDQG